MVKSEALSYLGITHDSETEVRRNELLFEAKQFFTKQPLIRSVFDRKLEKLKLQQKAFSLFLSMPNEVGPIKASPFIEKVSLIEQFNHFQSQKATLYGAIYNSNGYTDLIQNVQELLNFYDDFLQLWEWPFEEKGTIVIGKEADAMELLVELKQLQSIGIHTMNDLIANSENCPYALNKELCRMKTLKKRNENGRDL